MIARCRSLIPICSIFTLALTAFALATSASARGLDQTFGNGGISIAPSAGKGADATATRLARSPNGGWVVAGFTQVESDRFYQVPLWSISAYGPDGKPDQKFGRNGRVLRSDPGRLANLDGAEPPAVAVQRDGKVLLASTVNLVSDKERGSYLDEDCDCQAYRAALLVVRYRTDGKLDRSFGDDGKAIVRGLTRTATENGFPGSISSLTLGRNGRITVIGETHYLWTKKRIDEGDRSRLLAIRLTKGGKLDHSFGRAGRVIHKVGSGITDFFPANVRELPDGRTVVVGAAQRFVKHQWQQGVASTTLLKNGSINSSTDWSNYAFGANGTNTPSLDVAGDGKIIAVASRERPYPAPDNEPYYSVLARFNSAGQLDKTLGRNGLLDLTPTAGFGDDSTPIVRALPQGAFAVITELTDEIQVAIDFDANGTPGGPVPLGFPLVAMDDMSVIDVVADGSKLILTGTSWVKEHQRIFLAQLSP